MRRVLLVIMLMVSLGVQAEDSLRSVRQPKKESWLKRTLRGFTYIDTNYVEPQHYNWSVMLQGTYNYDFYRLGTRGDNRQSITFAPTPTMKVGPYFGWRWLFFGYTWDVRQVEVSKNSQTIDFSFYSAQIGADIHYRHTGSDYKIRDVKLGSGINTDVLEDVPFDGISVGITGANIYYIFNHKRFSYPAAFNQSTCQKISCGSWMAGLGYLHNTLEFDHQKLERLIEQRLPNQNVRLDSALMFKEVTYLDISASVGYAYNWVFARNWLFGASLSLALAYKQTKSVADESILNVDGKGFKISNINFDGIGRFGLVWNDTRWYAGASAIIRAYNYSKDRFAANNIFGNLNIYVGYNFGRRKK